MKLVTGHEGFIGSRLKSYLEDECHEECCGLEKADAASLRIHDKFTEYLQDMKIDGVYHLGAITDTTYQGSDIFFNNSDISYSIFEAAHKLGIRTVFASSASIYGNSTYPIPTTPYALSKLIAEYHAAKFDNVVVLRYFNVYGPGEENKGKMASVLYQAWKANQRGEKFILFSGSDHMRRDFVYVDDVVRTTVYAMDYKELVGTRDVGTCEARTFVDAMRLMGVGYEIDDLKKTPKWFQVYTEAGFRGVSSMLVPMKNVEWVSLEYGIKQYKDYLKGKVS